MTDLSHDHTQVDHCPACGGGMCGIHPAGCVYGGLAEGFWLVAKDCDLAHDALGVA